MSLVERFNGLSVKKRVLIAAVAAAVIAGVVLLIVLLNKGYYAKTMRLLRIEGTVNIEDANGNARPVIDNIRFNSGEALSTGDDGLASVGLDDTKIVTLENNSRVEFTKSRNMLELNLTQGGLYFEVTEHLSPDETFDIRTSTMTVGIRGTSGYVFYDDEGRESLVITDGRVHVVARNPDTGEVRETYVDGGYCVKVYLYDETREEGSIEFFLDQLDEDEIPGFPLRMLAENPELLARVCEDTGWSQDEILALANGLLDGDVDTEETEETEETSETEVTPTPTPEEEPEPSPSPTPTPSASPTPRPSVTPTPGAGADTTPTPTPAPTATPTPSPDGDDSVAPTPTPDPTPVTTPSPSPEPSNEEPETVEPEEVDPEDTDPEEETDPENEDDPEDDQTETVDWSEPTSYPPGHDDYYQYEWGEVSYNGHPVYVLGWEDASDSCLLYMGNGEWVEGQYIIENSFVDEYGYGDCTGYYYPDEEGNLVPYYEYAFEYQDDSSQWPEYDDPGYPHSDDSDYTYTDLVYGTEFKGHPTFITAEEYTPAGSTSSTTSYYAYYPNEWVPLTRRLSADGTMIQYVLEGGMIYYEMPAN